jgi:hypothetical protein
VYDQDAARDLNQNNWRKTMATTKGVVVFRGDYGRPRSNYSKTTIKSVTADGALGTLATALATYSDANYAKRSFITETTATDSAPGAAVSMDTKGVIWLKDTADGSIVTVTIPALKTTAWEVKDAGKRITTTVLTAVQSAMNTATGKTYTALYGKFYDKD